MFLDTENFLPNIRVPDFSISARRNDKHNSGRWKLHEHEKFLEAVIVHGNDWKLVQKCIKSRSSTQARSHAQKFLLKLKKKLKIEPDSSNKLSKESIDKIVREIVETSSYRHNINVDKEKLVKLIMGFSNLLVARVSSSGNAYENNCQDNYCDGMFNDNRKVFHIEKIVKSERRNSLTFSTADSLCSNLYPSEAKPIQIQNQNDLLKYLLQNSPQVPDPSNPNKNVINIISINICNKNEGENNVVNNNNGMVFPQSLFQNASSIFPIQANSSSSDPNLKKINVHNTVANIKSIPVNIKQDILSKQSIVVSSKDIYTTPKKEGIVNKTAPITPSTCNFDKDFYENSTSNTYFNQKNVEDDIEKFFDWN